MVKGQWFPQGSDISVPLRLRAAVFSRGRDSLDDMAQQVVVYQDDTPVGAARLWWADGAFRIGDVGVLPTERGKGFGDLLVRLLLFKAVTHHALMVEVSAPADISPFFARYGFAPADGSADSALAFMTLRGEDIALSHCGGSCADCSHQQ